MATVVTPLNAAAKFADLGVTTVSTDHSNDTYYVNFLNTTGIAPVLKIKSGGTVNGVYSFDNSVLNMTGGSASFLNISGNSDVVIGGGSIANDLKVYGSSVIDIYGGSISGGIYAYDDSIVYIHGMDFMVDGQPVSGGNSLSAIAPIGVVTGTYDSGVDFTLSYNVAASSNADIIVLPEPAVICFLLLGGLFLLKHNHGHA